MAEVAEVPNLPLNGPAQHGRGVQGQYVYWLTFSHPKPETVERFGVKTPAEFTREEFTTLVVDAHAAVEVELVEAACFLEPHENGQPHLNVLVRGLKRYKWKPLANKLRQEHKVFVDFAQHIKTWAEGVVYGCVATCEHKKPEQLDQTPSQWAKPPGVPTPLEQFLPTRWQQPGFVRQVRLSSVAFYDLCTAHNLQNETELWAKATELSEQGDRALLAYVLDNDGEGQLGKVLKARAAQERVRRNALTREQLLEEHVANNACVCPTLGRNYDLAKDFLRKNNLDGPVQHAVLGALRAGRAKKRTVCLVGGPDCGKSFVVKGLKEVFSTYERPDGGSYQLEELLDKELVFLNDFEYDASARDWMPWFYFKNFLEGGSVTVARPKNRGGNKVFKDDAPVLMTAPQEVSLKRSGKVDVKETEQMQKRICYFYFNHEIPEDERVEVLKHCGHCTSRLVLEGRAEVAEQAPAGPHLEAEPVAKRPRSVRECVQELKELKELLDAGVLSSNEFESLKAKLLSGE